MFIWLDLEPSARFAHATRFVLVGDSGTVHEYERRFWPFIRGQAWLDDATDRRTTTLQILLQTSDEIEPTSQDRGASGSSFVSSFTSTVYADGNAFRLKLTGPCPIGRAPRHFAIVIQGDPDRAMQRDTDNIYEMLIDAGYDSNSIQYLSPDSNRREVDQKVSAENIKKALGSLAKQIECCDTLFIYVASHGTMIGEVIYQVRDSTGQVINIRNEDPRAAPSEMESKGQKYMGQQLADGTRTRFRSDGSRYFEKEAKHYQLMIRTKKGAKAEVVLGSELAKLLREIKSCQKLLLLDTSHSAAIFHSTATVPGLITIAASDVGATAQQSGKGGDFTVPFVNAYTESTLESDSDGDGQVTPQEAASFADNTIQGEAQRIINSHRNKLEAKGRTPEQIFEGMRRWINPGFRWLRASRLWNQDPQVQTPKQLCICSTKLESSTQIPLATTAVAAQTVVANRDTPAHWYRCTNGYCGTYSRAQARANPYAHRATDPHFRTNTDARAYHYSHISIHSYSSTAATG